MSRNKNAGNASPETLRDRGDLVAPRSTRNVAEYGGLNLELLVFVEILKLRSLHYGYWDTQPEAPITLADVRNAQASYTEHLLSFIPSGVRSVLDVGSGIGDNAMALSRRGIDVVALSPDRHHAPFYRDLDGHSVTFIPTRFEEARFDRHFDLVLMSESHNYFDARLALTECRRLLSPGRFLLLSGMFKLDEHGPFDVIRHNEDSYLRMAGQLGFELFQSQDITTNVLPTIQFARHVYQEHVCSALNIGLGYVETAPHLKMRLLRLFMRGSLREIRRLQQYYETRLDTGLFHKHVRYGIYLFQRLA